jgi:Uma2 family endonuclease
MSTAPTRRRITIAEYVALERDALEKHEFYRGEIFAMAGASPRHNVIVTNILAKLYQQLEGKPCRPYGSDQRIRVEEADLSTYPDVSVICGKMEVSPADRHAATNPVVIFEVTSPSTEGYDRGPKFELYQQSPTLQQYVIVEQVSAKIVTYERDDDGTWRYKLLVGTDQTLELPAIGSRLALADVYRDVEFGPEAE